ncbi:hypothetical protein Tco_0929170 [Tanacetum coccineum]
MVNGTWSEDPTKIKDEMFKYYNNMFMEDGRKRPKFCNCNIARIDEGDATNLEIPFSEAEVWEAVKGYGSDKAPGPNERLNTIMKEAWSRENACKRMYILKCFEEVSELGVNLRKSCLYRIGMEGERVDAMAQFMKCSVGESPFTCLGLPSRTNMRRIDA